MGKVGVVADGADERENRERGMNITQKLTIVSLLLLAAGCAHRERQTARYDENLNSRHYAAVPANSGSSATSSATDSTAPSSASQATPATSAQTSQNPPSNTATGEQNGLSESDRQLVSKVQRTMNNDTSLVPLASNIQITAQNGTVTLSGTVPTEQDKQKLEMAAKSAPDVVSVNNQIQVSSQSAPAPSESSSVTPSSTGQNQPLSPTSQSTSSRIYTESQRTSPLPTTDSSQPDSFSQKIQGITQSDRELVNQISQQLKADSSMPGMMENVRIDISDGKATLRGHVSSQDEKSKIEDAVKQVSGVNSVDNQIQVNSALNQNGAQPKTDQGGSQPKQD